jgi:hypothetical protein
VELAGPGISGADGRERIVHVPLSRVAKLVETNIGYEESLPAFSQAAEEVVTPV